MTPEEVALAYEANIYQKQEHERQMAVAMRMAQGAKNNQFKKYLQSIEDKGKKEGNKSKIGSFFNALDKATAGAKGSGKS